MKKACRCSGAKAMHNKKEPVSDRLRFLSGVKEGN